MDFTQCFVYRNRVTNEEGELETWGVVAFTEDSECFLCPDVSVDRAEAEAFADKILQDKIPPTELEEAVNEYIEHLYDIPVR